MNSKTIPIFFTIDNQYAPYVSVAIQSIIENASKDYAYKIIVLHQELTEENKQKIKSLETDHFEIRFEYIKDGLETITDRVENKLRCDYFTLTIYFRIFIADMFPEYDKGIYLDSDIVVPGDISELYNIELGDHYLAACQDHSIEDVEPLVYYIENAVGIQKKQYVNSGILLMNLKLMREKKFAEKFLTLLNQYHFDSIAPDQDYINAMCHGKIVYLGKEWDSMPVEGKQEIASPKLIHYNLFDKPWCYDDIKYEDYFWNYAKKNLFYENILENKKNYSAEQKKADIDCLNLMIEKANEIPHQEITFKKLYESGADIRL